MDFLHKEFINKEHICSVITQALSDDRKLYCRHHNDDEHHEVQIYCVKMTDANLCFRVEDSSRFKVQINNFLVIQFTVRHENKFLPCEISVRVKSLRLTQPRDNCIFIPHFPSAYGISSAAFLPDIP